MIKNLIGKQIRKNGYLTKKALGFFIKLHNYSYKKITEYSSILNGGFNPKHGITKYHEYFLKNISQSDSVLDIGCGVGILAWKVSEKAKKVVGIDISDRNISYAKDHYRNGNLQFINADATKYPFTGSFDKLILSNVLEHIDDRIGLLKKLHVLGPILILRVPMITRDWMPVYKRDNDYPYKLDDTHYIEYTLEEIEKEAAASGWEIESYQVNWGEFWGILKRR